eukprot:1233941-Pleurochrysis_carterae.AAC.1
MKVAVEGSKCEKREPTSAGWCTRRSAGGSRCKFSCTRERRNAQVGADASAHTFASRRTKTHAKRYAMQLR